MRGAIAAISAATVGHDIEVVPESEPRPDIPDRVSIEQDSPFFFKQYVLLGVRVNGKDSQHVVEFCVSEGWARICQRNGTGRMKRDRTGRPLTTTIQATVEPYWRDRPIPDAAVVAPVAESPCDRPAITREMARRLRQAEARELKRAKTGIS